MISATLAFLAVTLSCQSTAEEARARDALRLVGEHSAVWTAPPVRTPADHSVDGPLLGNGDLKVALGGTPEEQRFFLAKNDLWRLESGYGSSSPVGFGELLLRIPELEGASYGVAQSWAVPSTVGTFTTSEGTVRTSSMVAATRNLLVLRLEAEGRVFEVDAVLRVASGRGSLSEVDLRGDVLFGRRAFLEDVDIPSDVAVACKVLGAETKELGAESLEVDVLGVVLPARTLSVQIGREQWGGGRWGFQGAVDDLRVYGRALGEEELKAVATGEGSGRPIHQWSMDDEPGRGTGIEAVEGKRGDAWRFTGDAGCFVDGGEMEMPIAPVTVTAWIHIAEARESANYVLSCGEWNRGVSLGLSAGKLRFAVDGRYVESDPLPENEWIHVAGTWNGSRLLAFVNGKAVASSGDPMPSTGVRFTLSPERPVTVILAMDSLFADERHAEGVVRTIESLLPSDLDEVNDTHAAWWADYWSRSFVEIGDPALERHYYRSLYSMGAASRDRRFPPGIFGWVTTDSPWWSGDYHTNYNHMAPFYALYSANRIEQADPEDAPILDFRERGRWYAANVTKTRGVLYPVGIGPLGIETTVNSPRYREGQNKELGGLFFYQRSNAAYCLANMAQRWRCTYDPDYGRKIYPFVREVVDFWEDYLRFEEGRYVIVGDAIHEGSGRNVNPILSLGLIRNVFDLAVDMSRELDVDDDRRDKWRHVLEHLSGWTTQERGGRTVFRYTEKGTDWWGDNTLGIQHIYPGNALGLDSDPKWLAVAHETISVMGRWIDFNGSNSFFPAAVRVGYDPEVVLEKLGDYVANTYPNGFQLGNPHGMENFSTTPNTINMMLCMGHVPVGMAPGTQVLRVFPVWPRERDARFVDIRTWGAFLVSSELAQGRVQYVRIESERGRNCTVVNPWPGEEVVVRRPGGSEEIVDGARFELATSEGETLLLEPRAR